MKLIEMLTTPWAIRQEELSEIHSIINAHLRGPKLNLSDLEAKILSMDAGQPKSYAVENRTAIIDISGTLTKNVTAFDRIFFDGIGMADIQDLIRQAADDSEIDTILLAIDSPGGTVSGTQDLADEVFRARSKKKVIALANGCMCSAAYWIGSQADEVYIANDTTWVGSIGILSVHADTSKMDKSLGITITDIYSGKYKAVGSPNKPLSEDDKQIIQDRTDYVYGVFVDTVARGRGVSIDVVLEKMADARVFIGKQAIDAGLVDGVSTQDQLINKSQSSAQGFRPGEGGPDRAQQIMKKEKALMNIEKLKAEHPEIFEEAKKLGEAAAVSAIDAKILEAKAAGIAEGAESERKRIQDVKAQLVPGHEALIGSMMFDGKTTGEQAAVQVVKAEKEAREKQHEAFKADGPAPVTQTEPENAAPVTDKPIEETAKADWDKDAKLRAEFGDNFKSYLAFKNAEADGRAKIKRG